ncbi:uncharacterized protein LOC117123974 [Anneissia japonica]|uniref:uncharacterized protein LOC117123974 n=1 Tax=Anneissia japonica TaxID=1529436 RepID=UPI0014256A56|nr:uncharacterized protein LOC117123974 [Anneissia japonica]
MDNPREIANLIKLFEESFEDVEMFLQNYQLGLGDDGGLSKPNAPSPSKSMPAGGKPTGSSRPRTSVVDGKDNNDGAESEHRPSGSCQELSSLDKAKKDLVDAYAINSIFWMYLCVQGIDPRNHHIKHELDRIRIKGRHLVQQRDLLFMVHDTDGQDREIIYSCLRT